MTTLGRSETKHFTRPHSVCSRRQRIAGEASDVHSRYDSSAVGGVRNRTFVTGYATRIAWNDTRSNTKRIQDIEREKYSFKTLRERPKSAPHFSLLRYRRNDSRSASQRSQNVRQERDQGNRQVTEDMFSLVKAAKEAKEFTEESELNRAIDQSRQALDVDEKNVAPVFNKRLFASQGAVIITQEARRLMTLNATANEKCDLSSTLSKSEVQCLRCVVDGLKLVHKGQDFVKDVLSKVISYETYKAFEYVPTKGWEDNLACYYILNGAVEVTYDLRSTESRNVYQANIIYSHGTGEYLGLVSPEGPTEDLAPPATIYTKEFTQFIRIDRGRFHQLMSRAKTMIDQRKREYISSHSFLAKVSEDVREKILHKLEIQEYPANRSVLSQGEISEYLYIVMQGRCQTYREVYIPEAEKDVLFYLTSRDPDDFFGEECVLDHEPSEVTVVTATASVILKLHRTALKMVQKDKLSRFIEELRHENPSDENLRDRGYRNSIWNKYKHTHIKGTLKEGGKLRYLSRPKSAMIRERPPNDSDIYIENMRQFTLKGGMFDPVRAQSAYESKNSPSRKYPKRPHTALPGGHVSDELTDVHSDEPEYDKENVPDMKDHHHHQHNQHHHHYHHHHQQQQHHHQQHHYHQQQHHHQQHHQQQQHQQQQSSLMTLDKAKEMELNIAKAMESKESLLKILDEPDVTAQMRQAWKAEGAPETQNFMKNGVLVTMTSEDIVRKAKALADTYVDKGTHADNEEDWDTILHAENKQAKMLISANKLRIKDIKRRLAELHKQRERQMKKNTPRRANYFSDDDGDDEDDYVDKTNSNNNSGNIATSSIETYVTSDDDKLISEAVVNDKCGEKLTDILETENEADANDKDNTSVIFNNTREIDIDEKQDEMKNNTQVPSD